jgi:hypothetical protein
VHDGGLGDAGLVHRGDQRLDGAWALLRPVRALAEQRRRRIALLVVGDDVRVDVDTMV